MYTHTMLYDVQNSFYWINCNTIYTKTKMTARQYFNNFSSFSPFFLVNHDVIWYEAYKFWPITLIQCAYLRNNEQMEKALFAITKNNSFNRIRHDSRSKLDLKFSFSENVTKIWTICHLCWHLISKRQNNKAD